MSSTGENLEAFYEVMKELKSNDQMKKHKSPTRRLIQQKNSAWDHK